MISIIFPSRLKNNPDSALNNFFTSLIHTTTEEERKQLEVLIKFDTDDDNVPESFKNTVKDREGITIRTFTYARGEGRSDINNVLSYLGTLVNPESKLIMNFSDDFIYTRPGWVTEILSTYDTYKKSHGGYLVFSEASAQPHHNIPYDQKPYTFQDVPDFDDIIYNDKDIFQSQLQKYVGENAPVFSREVFSAISGQFWMPSIDGYFAILCAYLAIKFNINIYCRIANFYMRTSERGDKDQKRDFYINNGGSKYNLNEYSGHIGVIRNRKNLFPLIERQAKNIYLDLKEKGIVKD